MRNKPGVRAWRSALCVVATTMFAGVCLGQALQGDKISTTGLTMVPKTQWERAFLTVVGPKGFEHQQIFEGGGAITFAGLDARGDVLPDGGYKYQLRLVGFVGQSVDESRKSTLTEGPPIAVRTGTFRIEGGALVAEEANEDGLSGGVPDGRGSSSANAALPRPRATNHFTGSITTTGRLCSGGVDCSSGYTPSDSLELIDAGIPEITFRNDLQSPNRHWEIEALNSGLQISDILSGDFGVVFIEEGAPSNSLRIDEQGRVGIGTSTPGEEIHTFDTFINDIRMENMFGGLHSQWSLSADENRFQIEDEENGTTPFRIEFGAPSTMINLDSTGNVGINTSNPDYKLHVAGDLGVDGDMSILSSRLEKRSFASVDGRDVLERVVSLPLQEWAYITDSTGSRHLGPMAEDFHAAFSLGRSAQRLSPSDEAGVALAAIQGLHQLVVEENRALRRDREQLLARLAALEAIVTGLVNVPSE